MPMNSYNSLLTTPAAGAGAAYNTSTTLTDVSPAPQLIIPANYLYVGSAFRLTAVGVFGTTGAPTLLLGFYYGGVAGVALAASAATATTSGAVTLPFRLELTSVVRSVGSSGTVISNGWLDLGTSLTAVTHSPLPVVAQTTVTIDTTAAKAVTLGAQWGTSSASNTLTCNQFLFEALN